MASHPLPPGQIYRINTGALLPPGADAVVMVEDTLVAETDAAGEEVRVEVLAQVDAGENVRKQGSDVRKGERVLEAGTVISDVGGELGTLAFVGRRSASVYRKPVVAILSTGNELCDLADPSSSGAIADSNRPSLQLALEAAGYSVVDLGIAVDDADATERALRRGLEQADVVVATGGTSMGELDLLKPVIERRLDGTIHFGRVAVKPGKPTVRRRSRAPLTSPDLCDGRREAHLCTAGQPGQCVVHSLRLRLPGAAQAPRSARGEMEAALDPSADRLGHAARPSARVPSRTCSDRRRPARRQLDGRPAEQSDRLACPRQRARLSAGGQGAIGGGRDGRGDLGGLAGRVSDRKGWSPRHSPRLVRSTSCAARPKSSCAWTSWSR